MRRRVFPHIPQKTYVIVVEDHPRVILWQTDIPVTSLKQAREEGKRARKAIGDRKRILILSYNKGNSRNEKCCWEVK